MTEIAYLFPGQGAQYVGMGKSLFDAFEVSRRVYEEANEVLGYDLAGICFAGPEEKLRETEVCQPAVLTTSIAALRAWQASKGAKKCRLRATAGLSLGEYAALVCAGSLGFADALEIVEARSRFMMEACSSHPGKMAAIIGLEQSEVEEIARLSGCEVANYNSAQQTVVSGREEAVAEAVRISRERGARGAAMLEVAGPFHSSLMAEASEKLAGVLRSYNIESPGGVAFVSNVSAQYLNEPEEIIVSLIQQVKSATRWEESIRLLQRDGIRTFFEIGPGKVLKGLLKKIDPQLVAYNIENREDIDKLV